LILGTQKIDAEKISRKKESRWDSTLSFDSMSFAQVSQEPAGEVCDVIALAYTEGNLHPNLKIQETGNRETLLLRMDYF
jgi:hypothetical protein